MLATNAVAICFPLRELPGFDARDFTPQAVLRITVAASEIRSAQRAEIVLREVANLIVSDNTILRIVGDVGRELAERRDAPPASANALAARPENVPELARACKKSCVSAGKRIIPNHPFLRRLTDERDTDEEG